MCTVNGKEVDDDPVATIGKAVGEVACAFFAAWGVYMLFRVLIRAAAFAAWSVSMLFSFLFRVSLILSSESSSSSRKEADSAPLAYRSSQGLVGASAGGGPSKPSGSMSDQWCCPPEGWVKVNTDASLKESNSLVAIGGVIRDHEGVWQIGFAGKIPSCSIEEAELWAIRVGLETAWDEGFTKIEIETDSEAALCLLNNQKVSNELVDYCRTLIGRPQWSVDLKQCPKKCNKVADAMADLGHGLSNFSDENEKIEYYFTAPTSVVRFHYNRELNE